MDWQTASAELRKKLDPAHVKGRKQGGGQVSYIEGWHAIAEANRIFGFESWTRETVELRQLGEPREIDGKTRVDYMARVRINVAGVVRDGCGFGQGIDRDVGQAHESALKEAETDAMKRALMTFGNPFGLALYDKSRENVGVDAPPFDPNAAISRILKAIDSRKTLPDLNDLYKREKDTIDLLTEESASRIMAEFKARKAKLTGPDPAMQAPPDEVAA